MTLHLYALAEHPARLPQCTGIEGSALAAIEIGSIDAVVSELLQASPDVTEETILAHADVVSALAQLNNAVLPARLARPYENEAALVESVRARATDLVDALERVQGCVEMGVRVVRQRDEKTRSSSGSDYMRGRLEAVQEAERLGEEIEAAVGRLVRDRIGGATATRELVLRIAYLVRRDEAEAFREAVETLATARPELAYVCVGPLAPYSFALVDAGADGGG